jgi:hypothetical protein
MGFLPPSDTMAETPRAFRRSSKESYFGVGVEDRKLSVMDCLSVWLRRCCALAIAAGLAAVAVVPPLSAARAERVDIELILAVDVSGSVDPVEARLQRNGYLQALGDPAIVKAMTSGPMRRVAVSYVEWAGAHYQIVVVDWTVIRNTADARVFASKLQESPPTRERWTSISGAIDFAVGHFKANPHKGERRVLDISGDGVNNSGGPLEDARGAAIKAGVTINGLPIVNDRPNPWGGPATRDLDKYYSQSVIGGPGSFIVVARGFEAFGQAIRHKLLLELSGVPGTCISRGDRTWVCAPQHAANPGTR